MPFRPIKPIGKFLPLDEAGFVINDTSLRHIPAHWRSVLDKIVATYEKELGKDLDSVYLRGSLARGLQIDGFSDIDTFALVYRPNLRWEQAPWQATLQLELQNTHSNIREIEVMLNTYDKKLIENYPALAMQIKTQSLCLRGNDFARMLPRFQPNESMMQYHQWLEADLADFQVKRQINHHDCQQLMKGFLRTGFELVMIREGRFTADLYWCYRTFSKYYPHYEAEMYRVLHFYLNPSKEKDQIFPLIQSLGKWLVNEVKKSKEGS